MVSGFTAGALGFGFELDEEQLAVFNAFRAREGKEYLCAKFGAPHALCKLGGR